MTDADKTIIRRIVIAIFVCLFIIFLLFGYSYVLEKKLNSDIKVELEEVSNHNSGYVNSIIKSKLENLVEIADRLSIEKNVSYEEQVESLKEAKSRHGFKRIGIAKTDGTAQTAGDGGTTMSIKNRSYFTNAMEGKTTISSRYKDLHDNADIIVFSSPIWKNGEENGEVLGVLFATYDVQELKKLFNIDFFNGYGYYYIVDADGNIILDSREDWNPADNENVFQKIFKTDSRNKAVVDELKSNFGSDEHKYFKFYNKGERYMYFSSLEPNDWYMLNIVKASAIEKNKDFIMNLTYCTCAIMIFIFALLVVTILRSEKNKNDKLKEALLVDPLTKGYSYQKFLIKGREMLNQSNSSDIAFVLMDIDGFKLVNEIYGYDIGDDILKHIWSIFYKHFGNTSEVFARKTADKFVALIHYTDIIRLEQKLGEIILDVQNCYLKSTKGYILKPKLGVYLIKDKSESIDSMFNYSILACAKIKGKAESDIEFYSESFGEERIKNKLIEDEMEYAYANKNFVVYYQPKYSSTEKKITGAEALIRWKKEGKIVPPGMFIPVAEENGFITKLDEYVFEEVCKEQKRLLESGIEPVPVSVNVSQKHLYFNNFVERYTNILESVGIDGKYVQIELTESAMYENRSSILKIINELKKKNFKILMDDFGTGYSSLMMLKSIPIDVMKLDKTFVDDYNQEKGEMIIRCVVNLAKEMNIAITAEGVETEEQYEFLKELKCDDIQGYYFAKPMPEEEYESLLKDNN